MADLLIPVEKYLADRIYQTERFDHLPGPERHLVSFRFTILEVGEGVFQIRWRWIDDSGFISETFSTSDIGIDEAIMGLAEIETRLRRQAVWWHWPR